MIITKDWQQCDDLESNNNSVNFLLKLNYDRQIITEMNPETQIYDKYAYSIVFTSVLDKSILFI